MVVPLPRRSSTLDSTGLPAATRVATSPPAATVAPRPSQTVAPRRSSVSRPRALPVYHLPPSPPETQSPHRGPEPFPAARRCYHLHGPYRVQAHASPETHEVREPPSLPRAPNGEHLSRPRLLPPHPAPPYRRADTRLLRAGGYSVVTSRLAAPYPAQSPPSNAGATTDPQLAAPPCLRGRTAPTGAQRHFHTEKEDRAIVAAILASRLDEIP